MKIIGLQIKSAEAIIVVLKKEADGRLIQTDECIKLSIKDPSDPVQVRQFRDQINSTFDNINPDKIAILARNYKAKGTMTPSPMSFKLEGIIQLYDKRPLLLTWPQSVSAYTKKNASPKAKYTYQQEAFDLAFYTINN
jgi:hypothetical protein